MNSAEMSLCGYCGEKRGVGSETGKGGWSCEVCTFINEAKTVKCELCNSERETEGDVGSGDKGDSDGMVVIKDDSPPPSTASGKERSVDGDKWECLSCTWPNNMLSEKCAICETGR